MACNALNYLESSGTKIIRKEPVHKLCEGKDGHMEDS